jgi:ferric-dicitrate binding protein FerR (iron transport regulator)
MALSGGNGMTDSNSGEQATGGERERDALGQLIRAAGRRPAPRAEDYQRGRDASHAAWQQKLRSSRRRGWLYALAAALAMAAVGLIAFTQLTAPPPAARATVLQGQVEFMSGAADGWQPLAGAAAEIPVGARLRTVADGRAGFELADGVSLRVNSATEWVFASPERIELIAGTVYVDSGSGVRATGVEISTSFGVVRDIGTQFEVRALTTTLRLRVREGLVRLQRFADPALETGAGEQVLIDTAGAVDRRPVLTDDAEWSWTEALAEPMQIEGRSAFEVLTWVARETGKRLLFEDANTELRARNAILSGSNQNLTPMQTLEVVVATSGGLDYSLSEGAIVIRRR